MGKVAFSLLQSCLPGPFCQRIFSSAISLCDHPFPSLSHSRHLAYLMLFFNPISPFIHVRSSPPLHLHIPFCYVKEIEKWPNISSVCDCGAFGLSTKQFHKKLCLLIQFSKRTNACGEYYPLFLCDCEHVCGCTRIYMQHFLCFYFIFTHMSNCVNGFLYQCVPALNVRIVLSETLQQGFSDLLFYAGMLWL